VNYYKNHFTEKKQYFTFCGYVLKDFLMGCCIKIIANNFENILTVNHTNWANEQKEVKCSNKPKSKKGS